MKIALAFRGLLRCFEKAYPIWKSEILDKYDTDVYFDIWSEVGYYSGKGYLQSPSDTFVKISEGDRGFHDSGEKVNASRIMELYNPTVLHIEDFKLADEKFNVLAKDYPNAFTRPKNTLIQFKKVQQVYQHVRNSGIHYDIVINVRPDLILQNPLPKLNPHILYTMPSRNKNNRGTGDSLFISNMHDMAIFERISDMIPEYYKRLGYSCPHEYTQLAIQDSGLAWSELPVGAHVMHSPKGPYQEPE